jgi:hypothetical protein
MPGSTMRSGRAPGSWTHLVMDSGLRRNDLVDWEAMAQTSFLIRLVLDCPLPIKLVDRGPGPHFVG